MRTWSKPCSTIKTIKALGAANHAQWVWEESSGTIADRSMRARTLSSSITVVTSLLVQFNTVGLIVFGIYRISSLELSLGGLIAIVMLASRAVAPMGQFAALITSYEQTRTAYRALDDIMQLETERPEGQVLCAPRSLRGGDRFSQASSFSYPGSPKKSLADVSLSIAPGEHVGIIGKVGSGKTTLLKLIIGLYQAESGSISIDHIDINQIDPADLRRHVGYLSQDVELLRGYHPRQHRLQGFAGQRRSLARGGEISGVDLFVNKLPQGFDTDIGEAGRLPVRRPAPGDRARPRGHARRTDADPRRTDQQFRQHHGIDRQEATVRIHPRPHSAAGDAQGADARPGGAADRRRRGAYRSWMDPRKKFSPH